MISTRINHLLHTAFAVCKTEAFHQPIVPMKLVLGKKQGSTESDRSPISFIVFLQVTVLTRHLQNTNEDLLVTRTRAEELEAVTLPHLFETATPRTFAMRIPGFWQTGSATLED